jgi:hypothetical protein
MDSLPQPATLIKPNVQLSNNDWTQLPFNEMSDHGNTPLENIPSSTTVTLLPPVLDWRCAQPLTDMVTQTPPTGFDAKMFNYHEVLIARDVRKHEKALPWTNTNYSLLSQVVNSLSLSQSDTDRLLKAVILHYIINECIILCSYQQIHCLDSGMSMPDSSHQLKVEEDRVLGETKMRVLDLSTLDQPFSTQGVCMISPNQRLSCMTYDLWDTVQDLLNDGEHSVNAHFSYVDNATEPATQVLGELWTGEWWRDQQVLVGTYEKLLAIIIYVDETNVTFNGRNVHPVYISLGNLHVEYRCVMATAVLFIFLNCLWGQEQVGRETAIRLLADGAGPYCF